MYTQSVDDEDVKSYAINVMTRDQDKANEDRGLVLEYLPITVQYRYTHISIVNTCTCTVRVYRDR